MTTLEIACLNNDGANLLESGESAGAVEAFTKALRMSRRLMSDGDNSGTLMNDASAAYSLDQVIELNRAAEEERDCDASVFQRAVRIKNDSTSTWGILSEPQGIQMMAGIAILNLALTFHLAALRDDNTFNVTRNQALQKAVKLYECTFELQHSEDWESSSLVVMAILTNLAHAHALLGNMQVSDECSRQLLSTLMFLMQTENTREGASFDLFLGNIMHLIFRTKSSPNASAA
jgi:hypothetical protein